MAHSMVDWRWRALRARPNRFVNFFINFFCSCSFVGFRLVAPFSVSFVVSDRSVGGDASTVAPLADWRRNQRINSVDVVVVVVVLIVAIRR